jgi:hypothetical protein
MCSGGELAAEVSEQGKREDPEEIVLARRVERATAQTGQPLSSKHK